MSTEKNFVFLKISAVGAEKIFILKLNFFMKFSPRTCTSTKYTEISSCTAVRKEKFKNVDCSILNK